MVRTVLSQGITADTDNSVGTALIKLLSSKQYHTFTAVSAFASEAGINGLSQYIEAAKSAYKALNLIVGVDQKGTSKEALEAILGLGINSRVFYQTGFSIFHPKIYLFEGDTTSQLIMGSSNLTAQGLFVNVEASVNMALDHNNPDDVKFIEDLKARFGSLFDFSDPNLQSITQELIEQLVAEKIVPTEDERKAAYEKVKELEGPPSEPVERVIRTIFPKRSLPSIPAEFRSKRAPKTLPPADESGDVTPEAAPDTAVEPANDAQYTLAWVMHNIPGSSVQITRSVTTNPTGMIRLVQADYYSDGQLIDQTTYFRRKVFNGLSWVPETTDTDIAIGKFKVSILGQEIGEHPLRIRHKPSGEAGQGNYTTGISWGSLGRTIRDAGLTGRTVKLYRLSGSDDTFRLEFI